MSSYQNKSGFGLKELFTLRNAISRRASLFVALIGLFILIGAWFLVTTLQLIPKSIVPSPLDVIGAIGDLHFNYALIRNTFFSIQINVLGYLEAILISLPLGFVIGLFPAFREMFRRYLDAIRFIPMAALLGVFIAWFRLNTNMKVQFLAASIIVYLLPIVVQRIQEVDEVYLQTVKTLGATPWQKIRKVFVPAVVSTVYADIRVIVAISWTYISIAESAHPGDLGGIGHLIDKMGRLGKIDMVIPILIIIMVIGYVQDRLFVITERWFFPHKRPSSA